MTRRTLAIVLALLHAYIGLRLLAPWDWPLQLAGGLALAALWVTLVSAVTPIFERREHSALLWAGLLGIGFFSSLFVLTLLREPVLLALRLAGSTTLAGWPVAAFTSAAVAGLALLASVVGFLNARRLPAVREVQVPIAGLPAALEGFTLVQISDLHVGLTIRRRFVQGVVERVNRLRADAVVVTGDSIDGLVHELHEHVAPLGGLQARHGVFAVTGNHEYYSGAPAWIDEFRRLGLDVLINEHRLLRHDGAALLLAGVPDWSAHHFVRHHRSDPLAALAGAPEGLVPKVLLAHQPRQAPAAAAAGFHLQLSGHTHGGQFLPWRWFVPLQQPYVAGLHRHEDLWIYTSRGTGYWGPPKRLGAPSEITRLRLVRAAAR
jgi:hypothetical protein